MKNDYTIKQNLANYLEAFESSLRECSDKSTYERVSNYLFEASRLEGFAAQVAETCKKYKKISHKQAWVIACALVEAGIVKAEEPKKKMKMSAEPLRPITDEDRAAEEAELAKTEPESVEETKTKTKEETKSNATDNRKAIKDLQDWILFVTDAYAVSQSDVKTAFDPDNDRCVSYLFMSASKLPGLAGEIARQTRLKIMPGVKFRFSAKQAYVIARAAIEAGAEETLWRKNEATTDEPSLSWDDIN